MKCKSKLGIAIMAVILMAGTLGAVGYEELIQLSGDFTNQEFGFSVANAGDVNGDGYEDIIIGAPSSYNGRGAAYIFFGGPEMSNFNATILTGEDNCYHFGNSVSGAGDVNGDGYDDVIVGAPGYYTNSGDTVGAAYIYFGGSPMDDYWDVKLVGEQAGDRFGFSVSRAGNVNHDDYADVIVGAPYYNDGSKAQVGAAYIFLGGNSMDSVYDVKMVGENDGDEFGYSVSGGNVNGDLYTEVIVGAPGYDNDTLNFAGAAYIFCGGDTMDSIYDVKIVGEQAYESFGKVVSYAGNVNHDNFGDVIIGAEGYKNGSLDQAGAAFIYYGGNPMDTVCDVRLLGENAFDWFGTSVASIGDFNEDGYDDVIVGADGYDNLGIEDAGAAYVFFGGNPMDTNYALKIPGNRYHLRFGREVAGVGDVNGDGYDEFTVSALKHFVGGQTKGYVNVYRFLYQLISPNGGEVWHVGTHQTISWRGGAAYIFLSVDGGHTWTILAENVWNNSFTFLVPHIPTRYALVAVSLSEEGLFSPTTPIYGTYYDVSDTFFTIQATVTLLKFNANPGENGEVQLTWQTDPGPDELAGYNLYRIDANGNETKINDELITELEYIDHPDDFVMGYALGAVNGLGEEYRIGEAPFLKLDNPIQVIPSIVNERGFVAFFVPDISFNSTGEHVRVLIIDASGRIVKKLFEGSLRAGKHLVKFDTSDLRDGTYFAEIEAGEIYRKSIKFQILRR